jgi:replicative DNA helicase
MELYLYIVKLFLIKKSLYLKYKDNLDVDFIKSNFPEVIRLFNALDLLHKSAKEEFAVAELEACLLTAYPNADMGIYEPLLHRVAAANPDEAAIVGYLDTLRERVAASKIAFLALDVAEGKADYEALRSHLSVLAEGSGDATEIDDSVFVTDDLNELLAEAYDAPGLRWRLESLNRSMGPLRKGNFGFIFARPETGKTTFLASEVTFMATQTEAPLLWINNEQPGAEVKLRLFQAALGATLPQVKGHKERAQQKYDAATGRRIKVIDAPGIDRRYTERLCRTFKPGLVVIDQIDKIGGFDGEREDLRMGSIYQWARELAKQYCPIIGVCQADGSGEGIKYLTMGNVANAKTAKQAEADWILGIGVSFEDHPHLRGMNICKNKLLGNEQTVPRYRHAKFDALIEPEIGRYKDMEGALP